MTSPKAVPPERERRRTERVPFEPLHVRLDRTRDGILVDLSEGGALLQMSVAPPQDRQIAAEIEWRSTKLALQARVVRAVQRHVQSESATLTRTEYSVALEFVDLTGEQSAAIRRILQGD